MSSLLPLLLALLALLGGAPPATASMITSVWSSTQVSQYQLAASTVTYQSYQMLDETICAILATNKPWCHLFTYEGNTCVLYDVVMDSLANPPPEDTATPCKIRHRNVCIVEGTQLAHGDTLERDCLNTICWNGALVPTNKASSKCNDSFSLATMGCVHLYKEEKNWCEARRYCSNLEADLAVVPPESFSKLQEFLVNEFLVNNISDHVWVGVKEGKWINGRNVTAGEWIAPDPNGEPDYCASMHYYDGNYALADNACTDIFWALCMRT